MPADAPPNAASGSRSLVISTLGAGGAERVLTTMANWWAARGRDITLITLDRDDRPPFYPLDASVRRIGLDLLGESRGLTDALAANVRRIRVLRKTLRAVGSDAVLSFGVETNILAAFACVGSPGPLVISERCDPRHVPAGRLWRMLRRVSYPLAQGLAVQTRQVQAYFSRHPRVAVIPNALAAVPELPDRTTTASASSGTITAMGRLVPQKGFDLLLEAFATLQRSYPDWTLVILGDGPQRNALQARAEALGISARVRFAGVVDDPFPLLASSDIFVLSSRFEGFPNALCEAMASGCAVIATDCPSGPAEIVDDGVNGLLVATEDVPALAQAMVRLAGDPPLRLALSAAARRIIATLNIEAIMSRWDELVARAAVNGGD